MSTSTGIPVLSTTSTTQSTTGMPVMSGMPTISATTATTSTWTTPIITPPSAAHNPHIWKSKFPAGLVFIVVGAIAGFFLLCFLTFLFISKFLAKRNAQKSLQLTDSGASSYNGGSTEKLSNPFYQTLSHSTTHFHKLPSQNKIPLLYENNRVVGSVSDVSDIHTRPSENVFSTLNAEDNNKRKSMFLSPTAEVMSYNKKQHYHQRMMPSVSTVSNTPDGSYHGGYGTPSQAGGSHERNSYDNTERSPERRGANRNKPVPSQYLEAMFEE